MLKYSCSGKSGGAVIVTAIIPIRRIDMKKFGSLIAALLTGVFVFALNAAPAHAQATRTWVSGVGDDANPCSRTAPCKTFAGAISKTASGGEINCLDPGGLVASPSQKQFRSSAS